MRIEISNEDKKSAFTRLERVLREKNIKPADFQKTLDIGSQVWNNWKKRGLPTNKFTSISKIIGVNTDWLATGRGEKHPSYDRQAPANASVLENKNNYVANKSEIELLDAFRGLTGEQKQSAITELQETARKNEQIIKELQGKRGP